MQLQLISCSEALGLQTEMEHSPEKIGNDKQLLMILTFLVSSDPSQLVSQKKELLQQV